jgi:hypothetical protein
MSEWQPIETAPRDGTKILVSRKPEPGFERHIVGIDMFKEGTWWLSRKCMQPSHWMPLPAPPESSHE